MSRSKFYLSPGEAELLRELKLDTPAEVIDYYQRTQNPLTEDLFLKTIGAMYQLA